MPVYRHYRLDGAGNITKAEWIEAQSDDEALRRVEQQRLDCASEIWDRDRRVGRIDPVRRGC